MFRRNKRSESGPEKSARKFFTHKDIPQRIKHLTNLVKNLPTAQIQKFFSDYHSQIFYTFFDSFDSEVRSKCSLGHTRDLENHLFILERILAYLPELVRSHWQYTCIFGMMRDLLHPKNVFQLQIYGLRIFLIWYQILGNSATEECKDLFMHLVPDIGAVHDFYKKAKSTQESDKGPSFQRPPSVTPGISFQEPIQVLVPGNTDDVKDQNLQLLRYLLRFSVTEIDKVKWSNSNYDQRPMCFWFLFEQLKRYYFPAIFPRISADYTLYDDGKLPPIITDLASYKLAPDGYPTSDICLAAYQEEVVRWISEFVYLGPRATLLQTGTGDQANTAVADRSELSVASESGSSGMDFGAGDLSFDVRNTISQTAGDASATGDIAGISFPGASSVIGGGENSESQQLKPSTSPPPPPPNEDATQPQQDQPPAISIGRIRQTVSGYFAEHLLAGSNNVGLEPVLPIPPRGTVEYTGPMISRVRDVLYCCRQNVDLLNSIFYHASLLPLDRYKALSCIALVYRFWIEENPIFMQPYDPLQSALPLKRSANRPSYSRGMILRRDASADSATNRGNVDSANGRTRVLPRGSHVVLSSGGGGGGGGEPDNSTFFRLRTNVGREGQSLPAEYNQEVAGCLQSTFKSMIINLSHVFLRSCPPTRVVQLCLVDGEVEAPVNFLRQQVNLCGNILEKVLQVITLQRDLRTDSWEKLLLTMLQIISEVMNTISETDRFDLHWMSNERLLAKFFQTFNTSLIYATLSAPISNEPWDKCLEVYSQITRFPALIEEWSKAVRLLTRQLGIVMFGVKLTDLPNEGKLKRGRRSFAGRQNPRNDRLVSAAVQATSSGSQVNMRSPRAALPGSGDSRPTFLKPSLEQSTDSQLAVPEVQAAANQSGASTSASGVNCSSEMPINPNLRQAVSGGIPSSRFDEDPFAAFGDFQPSESMTAGIAAGGGAVGALTVKPSRERRQHNLAASWNLETEETDPGDGDVLMSPSETDDWRSLRPSVLPRSNTNTSCTSTVSHPKSSHYGEDNNDNTQDAVLTPESDGSYAWPQPRRRTASDQKDSSTLCAPASVILSLPEQPRAKSCEHRGLPSDSRPVGSPSSTSGNGVRSCVQLDMLSGDDNRFDVVPTAEFGDMMSPTLKLSPSSHLNGSISASEARSVLLGGTVRGWTTDTAVACWRRFLGLLGDFSCISRPSVLLDVLVTVHRLVRDLLAIDAYQALSFVDGRPRPPSERVPIDFLCPVLLKILDLPNDFRDAKKRAMHILSTVIVRQHDVEPTGELLGQFYRQLHYILTQNDDVLTCEAFLSGCWRIFAFSLPASNLLILDFIRAANELLSDVSSNNPQLRFAAMSLLVSLLPIQSHFDSLTVLDSSSHELKTCDSPNLTTLLSRKLFVGVMQERTVLARQVAVCGLYLHVSSDLAKRRYLGPVAFQRNNPSGRSAAARSPAAVTVSAGITALLRCLRCSNRSVAVTAASMLRLLAEMADTVFDLSPTFPIVIIQVLSWNLTFLWTQVRAADNISPFFKQLLLTNISALVDWVMAVPVSLLVSPFKDLNAGQSEDRTSDKGLTTMLGVFSVLEFVASSTSDSNLGGDSAGPGWVAGCPFRDPLFTSEDNKQFHFSDMRNSEGGDNLLPFDSLDDTFFVPPQPVTPESIRTAARFAYCHLYNQLGRYPMSSTGDLINSLVQEHHDRTELEPLKTQPSMPDAPDDLSDNAFELPNLQIFVLNRSFLVSILTIRRPEAALSLTGSPVGSAQASHFISTDLLPEAVITDSCDVRILVRDLSGKYAWDMTHIYGLPPDLEGNVDPSEQKENTASGQPAGLSFPLAVSSDPLPSTPPCPPPRHKPVASDQPATSADFLEELLKDLVNQHPQFRALLSPVSTDDSSGACFEQSAFEKLASEQIVSLELDEHDLEKKRPEPRPLPLHGTSCVLHTTGNKAMERWMEAALQYCVCKKLINQLGFMSRSRRPSIELLPKSAGLVRELKHLDKRLSRETHKLAVVYVAPGQEEKQEILSNRRGSLEFENFVAGLGWQVELAKHRGFLGGLDQSGQTGKLATYFATSTVEVIFHVSTRMSCESDEAKHRVFKHLGNDEVMIIWTEHWRPFRRSSLRTEFGDILIIISPLANGLFRVEIRNESEIPFFGPLIDGCLVSETELPFLVRATAINANRAIHSVKPDFKEHYEERAICLESIISRYMKPTSFEDFVMEVVMPRPPPGFTGKPNERLMNQLQVSIPNASDLSSQNVNLKGAPRSAL
uniref:Rap-GAP domain-containing protein n=4 Tax=Schistocephalus solidus TaxID=70667 RepID=A0A0X3PIQ9_SCHSO